MLNQLKVIDCSTVLAGPSVGTFFAELGAQVIKIENPNVPDVTRSWRLSVEQNENAVSAYFSSVNYGKSYQTLDFNIEKDKEELFELLTDADILLTNFKFGDDVKFGLTDELLKAKFPKLIIGKISGFGNASDRVAYDLILQAETGFMAMNGTPDSGPVKMPVALIDVLAAHQLKEGILTALLNRTQTNHGSVISVSLYDAAVCSLANQASNYLMANHIPKRIGSLHPNIAPYGEIFITKDNKHITFAIGSQKHFQLLCTFLGLQDLSTDKRFDTNVKRVENRIALAELIADKVKLLSAQEITLALHPLFVPVGVVKNLEEVFANQNAQLLIRKEEIDGVDTKRVSQIAFKSE